MLHADQRTRKAPLLVGCEPTCVALVTFAGQAVAPFGLLVCSCGVPEGVWTSFILWSANVDPVFTCASPQVYKERVLDVSVNCAREAAKTGVTRFIEVSTAQVYDCDKVVRADMVACVHSTITVCTQGSPGS